MKAKVYKSTGSWYYVKPDAGTFWNARLKGVFKKEGISSTNPLAVGDDIEIEPENEAERSAIITEIYKRKNYINRQSPTHRWQHHIIAANIDQSILMASLKEPKTSQGFIDRFLAACEAYHIPAIIILNKSDLYKTKELDKFEQWKEMYESVGYKILLTSIKSNIVAEELLSLLKGKITLLSGHSGVGKSSLINHVFPSLSLKTQDVSGWSSKGIHTTTFAEMFDLPFGGQVIDTPGMREFGLVDIGKQELSHYFPEMRVRINECRFNNCLHVNEPGCAIKKALDEGLVYVDRYVSYCNILDSIAEKKY
ncbi:MAG: ribosome small subunit-dependent GTPase A [Bacteroidetes bacterium]|nr:ribosome small subunit-dependent GTPase A [Bacteroidota bacterium]MBS1973011.1 ribosome small subunit-dependent GTPase A [Bacteroidota bacterium]